MIKTLKKLVIVAIVLFFLFAVFTVIARGLFPMKNKSSVEKYCSEFSVDPISVYALIKAESNFNENAESHAGAKGVMQLTPATFDHCKSKLNITNGDIFDADTNIHCGVWYLSYLLEKYDNNAKTAFAAYNAGETNVDAWLLDSAYSKDGKNLYKIPFTETALYVDKIQKYIIVYKLIYF